MIPLQLKLVGLIISIVIPSLIFYTYYALNLFEKEQTALVYQNTLSVVEAQSKQIAQKLLTRSNKTSLGQLFKASIRKMRRGRGYRTFIVEENGSIYTLKPSKKPTELLVSAKEFLEKKINVEVRRILVEEVFYLAAFAKIPKARAILIRMIPESSALGASQILKEKSFWFGCFVLSLATFFALMFTRTLTNPLAQLTSATKKIVSENFQLKIQMNSRDEIGELAKSFNIMIREIQHYMEEMEEKTRLQQEIKTANLVQTSYFPSTNIESSRIAINSFCRPATECGGDWWGHLPLDHGDLIIIADATGHGVGAALVTASFFSCLNLYGDLVSSGRLQFSLESCASLFNTALFSNASDTKAQASASAFFLFIEHSSKRISYINASHTPCYITLKERADLSRSNLVTLNQISGPWLGKSKISTYQTFEYSLEKDSLLLLYTDGLLENRNPNNEPWPKRELLRELCLNIQSSRSLASSIEVKILKHLENKDLEDDMTFLTVEV